MFTGLADKTRIKSPNSFPARVLTNEQEIELLKIKAFTKPVPGNLLHAALLAGTGSQTCNGLSSRAIPGPTPLKIPTAICLPDSFWPILIECVFLRSWGKSSGLFSQLKPTLLPFWLSPLLRCLSFKTLSYY